MIDLHTHTTASDGTFTLAELVSEARRVGLSAIAVTDHDNVGSAGKITAGGRGMKIIPGIEISVFDKGLGYVDVHVLGLFIDTSDARLLRRLGDIQAQREEQKKETVGVLRGMGYKITFAEVRKKARGVVGRPHIAKALMEKYPEEFRSIPEVFDKLLATGKPAYVERAVQFPLSDAIALIKGAGGLSFLAHPHLNSCDLEKLASDFKYLGGNGIESHYDYVRNAPSLRLSEKDNDRLIQKYGAMASDLGLLESGGSDFHGKNKGQTLGDFGAPDAMLEKIEQARRKPL